MGNARRLELTTRGSVDFNDTANDNYIRLQAPDILAGNVTLTLPSADAAGYLKSNGAGVLSFVAATADLQGAYDNGTDITLDAGANGIDITGPLGLAEAALTITQNAAFYGITVNQAGAASGIYVNSTGGEAAILANSDLRVTNSYGLIIESSTGTAWDALVRTGADVLTLGTAASGDTAILAGITKKITFSTNGEAMRITKDLDVGIGEIAPGAKLDIVQTANNFGLSVSKTDVGNVTAAYINNAGTGYGLWINQGGEASGIYLQKTTLGASNAVAITNAGTGKGVYIVQTGEGNGIHINKTSGGALSVIYIDNAGTGDSIHDDSGACLSAAGIWTNAPCLKENKTNIESIETDDTFLDKLSSLSFSRYESKRGNSRGYIRKTYGLFLDELAENFNLPTDGVSALEIASLAIGGIKAIVTRLEKLEKGNG